MSFANVCKMRIPPFSWRKISVFMLQSSFLDSHVLFVCSTPMLASKHLNLSQLNSHVQGKTQSFTSRFVCWCSSNLHMFSIKPKNGKFDIIRSYLTWTTWNQTVSKKMWVFAKRCAFSSGKSSSNLFALPMETHMRKTMEKPQNLSGFKSSNLIFPMIQGIFMGVLNFHTILFENIS